MYKICATKRDLDIIDRKLYRFIPDLWEVNVTSKGIYLLKYEDGLYNLYSNGEQTTLFIPNISLIRGCVYEGQLVTVELTDDSLKRYIGTLIQINQDGEKAVSKSVVFSESECALKSPSQEYADNRLVREEDIIRPEQVSVYFDPRYLSIDHVKTNGIETLPMSFIPEYIDRLPGDAMSSEVQKTQACKSITCSKGDRVIVTKKEGVEYDIVITKVTDYASLETVLVNDSDTLEFDVNLTVFIEFQIPLDIYTLYTHCGEIHTSSASITINSVIDGVSTVLLHGECNEFGDYSVTSTPILVLPQKVVKIEVEATCSDEIGVPLVYSPTIRNLVTNLELSQTNISSNSQAWTGTFTMPEADCLVSPKLKYIYHDGGQEDINPAFYLTVKSSDLASVVVNNIEYDLTNGPLTMPCDVAYLNWELMDGYTSKIDVYSTEYPSNVFYSKVGFITHEDWVLSSNTTIEISLKQVDCEYKSFRGKVESLSEGKKWNSSNSILEVSGNVPYKTYYVDTNVLIADSGEPNHFEGTEVEEVVFYNPADSFYIHPKAFKKCEHLKSIDLSKSSNIRVKEEAFWGSFSLSDFKNTLAISELGEYSFTNTDLPSFTYGSKLLQIPDYTFMNCRDLADVDYESSSSLESVGKLAFDNCRKLKHAVFPKSLSRIGDLCFGENAFSAVHTSPAYCDKTINDSASCVFNVDSLEFKNGMTELPEYAFEFCNNIKEIYLPASIDLIKKGAFLDCDNIKHFMSPGLEIVEEEAFGNTWIEGIESAGLELAVESTTDLDLYKLPGTTGILFDTTTYDLGGVNSDYTVCTYLSPKEDNSRLILYKCNEKQKWPGMSDGGRYRYGIHHKTFSISPYAFSGNYDFGNVGCYHSDELYQLKYIGRSAFRDNDRLFSFYFPENGTVTNIGTAAFKDCARLKNLYNFGNLPMTKIGDYAFYNCTKLLPPNFHTTQIEEIGDYAFYNSFRMAYDDYEVTRIKSNILFAVGTIASYVFLGMACLGVGLIANALIPQILDVATETVVFAGDVISGAGGMHFGALLALMPYEAYELQYGKTDATLDIDMYNMAVVTGIGLDVNRGIYDIFFPSSLHTIGKYAFTSCHDIYSINFTGPITKIPEGCFYKCEYLRDVRFFKEGTLNSKPALVEGADTFTIKEVGKNAFAYTDILANAVNKIIYNATSVKERAFNKCLQLTANRGMFGGPNADNINDPKYLKYRVIIPPQLAEIGKHAFGGANIVLFVSKNAGVHSMMHPYAFAQSHDDDYNPYLYAAGRIALVPDGSEVEYELLFSRSWAEGNQTVYYRMFDNIFTYDEGGNIVKVINEW